MILLSLTPALLSQKIKLGIDVLIESDFKIIKGKKVGLLTNYAGRDSDGTPTAEILNKQKTFALVALMAPEHGYYTSVPAGNTVPDDMLYDLKVYSLYGKNRRPSKLILDMFDVVLIDIQDIGVRSYTFLSTVYNVLDACAEFHKPVIILDRPNPLGGISVDGNVLEPAMKSFVGIAPIPYIHGLTIGELATMFNEEGFLSADENHKSRKCNLTIIKMENWTRNMVWEDTGLEWYPTSPHIPTVDAIRGYAMLGLFGELGVFSIGIGTTSPFQYFGSPTFEPSSFMKNFSRYDTEGLFLVETKFNPFYGMYVNKECSGFLVKYTDKINVKFFSIGIKIFLTYKKTHPEIIPAKISEKNSEMFNKVAGTKQLLKVLTGNYTDDEVLKIARKGLSEFMETRKKYLLY